MVNDNVILETGPEIGIPDLGDRVVAATGRRKSATCRVTLRRGSGQVYVNGRPLGEHFVRERDRLTVTAPLRLIKSADHLDVHIVAHGGGNTGQAGAALLGLSRVLVGLNPDLRSRLRERGYLTRDSRIIERKKYGRAGARRSFQFSKR